MSHGARESFRFRGRQYPVRPGERLLRSLSRGRLPTLVRSIRYHRPRAPYCGTGICSQCLVRVNGVPNVRACTVEPRAGDVIETENAWPSPENDLWGILDHLFPRGVDTLHGFRRPRWLRPLYYRFIRRLAGFGRPPSPSRTMPTEPPSTVECELLVVGSGPAGRAAAGRARSRGTDVLLVDRGDLLAPPAGVRTLAHTFVAFLPPPAPGGPRLFRAVATQPEGRGLLLQARSIVVATGAYDGGLLFPGNDRPGVMTAEGALAVSAGLEAPPFSRALLVGGGERAAEILDRLGSSIAAALSPGSFAPETTRRASDLGVPLYPKSLLREARGARHVREVVLDGRGGGPSTRLGVDAIILAHRRLPHTQLLFQSGAPMEWWGSVGAYLPVLDAELGTGVPGLFAAGEAAGFPPGIPAEASGVAAGERAVGNPVRLADLPPRPSREGPPELAGYYEELLRAPRRRGKWVICACEDILVDELRSAHEAGYRGMEEVKRQTGVGTGLCQGRFCLPDTLLLLAAWERRPPPEVGYVTQRPPVAPVPLRALAGLPEEAP
jgi:sarcosine oxidase, subunit alpha